MKPTILVIEDEPLGARLAEVILTSQGYDVTIVSDGIRGLEMSKADAPALILLDLMLPGIDGYEVCRRLKRNRALAEIPVIFISALNETGDKLEGFKAGGVDYITKPFQFEEVDARVETHIELRRQRKTIQENYERLKELEELRDNLVKMIVHDMRSPLSGLLGYLELLERDLEGQASKDQAQYVRTCVDAASVLSRMIAALLDVGRLENGQMPLALARHDLKSIAQQALRSLGGLCRGRALDLQCEGVVEAYCDADVVRRIVANLVGNALKFTPKQEGRITVRIAPHDGKARVEVCDNGPGVSMQDRERIFEKFGQAGMRLEGHKHSTGLGLTFCKLAVEAQQGTIGVDSELGEGSRFWFTLPV